MKKFVFISALITMVGIASAADTVDFSVFNIRNNNSSISAPWDSDMSIVENVAGDGFSAATPRSGQKVGYGTSAFDGMAINQINSANWNTVVNGTGKAIVPYLNIWVTDGTNYAVISSENDYRGTDFSARQEWKIFEYDSGAGFDWLFDSGTGGRSGSQYLTLGGSNVTLADISSSVTIASPSPFPGYVGTGAPRGGYGFNIIMGDTAANYVGGFTIGDVTVTVGGTEYCAANTTAAVPAPGALLLAGIGTACVGRIRRFAM